MKRPTKPEKELIEIIKKYKLPFRYVGDGEVIIGGKCPDFLNCDGEKQVIEVFGRVFHDPKVSFRKKIPHHQTYEGTMKHYEKYGFSCLIIWDSELTGRGGKQLSEGEMMNKIEEFVSN